ncbi:hypothetical protein [Solitalea canadensis]|uniref:Uncharacterized protein n=1 Tax=Solitalea canadensis (strain ATCC 29591 / DSM 3403 / JCM 21819 / LMG 8368 / NBRC 15130 / NCIMB 12057 / USAM 9D) TaxID=929556 RepID=H8KNT4_SOLCM|nr:hypothetical protein [Solitalea canadensis]AFD05345.1 hypothetical protein Solca_0198 [Solitalea canadensis DSM 3403]
MKRKQTYLFIPATIILAIFLNWLLYLSYDKPNDNNGFTRVFIQPLTTVHSTMNDDKIVGIAGADSNRLFFYTKNPSLLVSTSYHLTNKQYQHLPFIPHSKVSSRFDMQVSNANVYLFAGNASSINYVNNRSKQVYHVPAPSIYTRAALADSSMVLLRLLIDTLGKQDQVFARLNLNNGQYSYDNQLSEIKGDIGFSTDGLLHYDSFSKLAIYIAFYNNHILCFDSNFKLQYKSRTIDTITTNRTDYAAVNSGTQRKFTNSSPKRIINSESFVSNGKLFVKSALKANNETPQDFSSNTVIDIYEIKNGQYLGSF